jgi:transcriptional regulator with XRE-family HTH domain
MARDSDAIPNLRLQDYRRRLDLTQDQVADELRRLAWEHFGVRVGVDGQMVSKWERGEKRPSRFYRQLLCLLYTTTEEQLASASWRWFRLPRTAMTGWRSPSTPRRMA